MKKKKIHELKTWPEFFKAIDAGQKTFEVRRNDRDFHKGDEVRLLEWNPATKQYTGNFIEAEIGFIIDSDFGLESGVVAFSLLHQKPKNWGYFHEKE